MPSRKLAVAGTDMIACPCCKQPVAVPTLDVVALKYRVTPYERAILETVWRGKGRPVPTSKIFDSMYADDPDGGPSQSKMYAAFKVALCHLRKRLEGSGVSIVSAGYAQGYRIVLSAGESTADHPSQRSGLSA